MENKYPDLLLLSLYDQGPANLHSDVVVFSDFIIEQICSLA